MKKALILLALIALIIAASMASTPCSVASSDSLTRAINIFESDVSPESAIRSELQALPQEEQQNLVSSILKARKAYLEWKRNNPHEASSAISEIKSFMRNMKAGNVSALEGDSMNEVVAKIGRSMESKLGQTSEDEFVSNSCNTETDIGDSWHFIIYGAFVVDNCSKVGSKARYKMRLDIFGPGLGYGASIANISCTRPLKGLNVGFGTTVFALPTVYPSASINISLLFGESGVCVFSRAEGAIGLAPIAAGINVLKIRPLN